MVLWHDRRGIRALNPNIAIDNHGSGCTRITYWAYLGSNKTVYRVNVSPDFHSFPELAAWVDANWLNKE